MKNLLKKLHVMSNTNNQGEGNEGSNSSRNNKLNVWPSPRSQHDSEHKPLSALTDWFQQVTNKKSPSPPSSSNVKKDEGMELSESAPTSGGGMDAIIDVAKPNLEPTISKDPGVEEEYQIQMAMEMSAREDPEAVQIEAVKQISLGSCPPENTPAEVVAYRYWNHNSLGYDDKILDGFYDLYGILTEDTYSKMPSLIDLQGAEVSAGINWEAVLVNRASDANLLKLEQKALVLAVKAKSKSFLSVDSGLVREIALLVSDYMGGPVTDPSNMLRAWKSLSYSLKSTFGSMVLPLGSLTIGLARHRALLFKVLADSVGIPCQLVKGQQYTGFDDVAMNIVKVDDGREYIVDLMGDPGSLIPSDATGTRLEYGECIPSPSHLSGYTDSSKVGPSSSGMAASFAQLPQFQDLRIVPKKQVARGSEPGEGCISTSSAQGFLTRPSYISHARSPSWTEGISSPAVRKMKVKDVSQYMIDAAKENPQLAQKLHDVLLESGVVAPANLFSEIYHGETDVSIDDTRPHIENRDEFRRRPKPGGLKGHGDPGRPNFLPPLPHRGELPRSTSIPQQENAMETDASLLPLPQPQNLKPAEAPMIDRNLDLRELRGHPPLLQPDVTPMNFGKNVPVTAAAVAAAAIVASSIVAAAKSSTESVELPVAAAATATAAAVVATSAAVGKQYEHLDSSSHSSGGAAANQLDDTRSDGDADSAGKEPQGSGKKEHDAMGTNSELDRVSDRSAGTESVKSDATLDDVADCEILWEEISLGERIGLGSYGEVYRGDWRGTEVAVKRFLDQDVYGEALEEFRSEVHIMKKVRHPNVVLFMGAVTRPPYLSIVTEFLHRGSLYRLLHRPNNQLDERRRLRMALDAARGMNYLHSCSPVIVHRDLKSPNLLVDRNWVVKVCDFGLSRMKHSTFLSSRSTAGTAEWMAPEVLRNEPSDEKCDVYSYGVILWELCTLQQPWGGMNPMQVVGAVGFQHRRLDIPDDIDPTVAQIIRKCWETDPKLRPTFAEIMAALKPLQKPVTASHAQKSSISRGSKHIKAQQSHSKEEAEG